MKYLFLGIFLTSAASLSAQSAPIEEGHSIFVSNNYYESMKLLGTSGDIRDVPGVTTQNSYGFAYDPFSDLLFSIERNITFPGPRLISVNPRTAQRTEIGGFIGVGPMAVHPVSGELYYVDEYNNSLYTVDRLTGNRTWIASTGQWALPFLAFHPQSHELYTARPNGSSWSLYTIDIATGQQTWVTVLDSEIYGLAFNDQGTPFALSFDYAHVGPQKLVTLDINSGLTTTICDYPGMSHTIVGLTFVPPLSSPSLSLSPVAPIGGQSITISLSHAKAEADTWLTWSLTGPGAFPVAQLGITLGLSPPISHGNSQLSRLDGRVTFSGMVPPLVGTQVWMQAAQAGVISEVQTFTIQ